MVPFWQRRLLAVTLPAVLLGGCTAVATALYAMIMLRPSYSTRPPPDLAEGIAFWAFLSVLVPLVAVLSIARPKPMSRDGVGLWIAVCWLALLGVVYVLASAMGFVLLLNEWFMAAPWLSLVWVIPIALAGIAGMLLGVRRYRPRTRAITVGATRLMWTALAFLVTVLSAATVFWRMADRPDSAIDLSRERIEGFAVFQVAVLFGAAVGFAITAFFAKELARRHAAYHARHCHRCGYDLLGVADACPECGHALTPEQRRAVEGRDVTHHAQEPGDSAPNGGHMIRASPTASR
jgi:hypothetical protein